MDNLLVATSVDLIFLNKAELSPLLLKLIIRHTINSSSVIEPAALTTAQKVPDPD